MSEDCSAFISPGDRLDKLFVIENNLDKVQVVSLAFAKKAEDPFKQKRSPSVHFKDILLAAHASVKLSLEHSELSRPDQILIVKTKDVFITRPLATNYSGQDVKTAFLPILNGQSTDKMQTHAVNILGQAASALLNLPQDDGDTCASRVTAMISLRRFLKEESDKARLDVLIRDDVHKLREGFGMQDMWSNQSWIGNPTDNSPDLESVSTFPNILASMYLAVANGYTAKPQSNFDPFRLYYNNSLESLPSEDMKLIAFAYNCYVISLIVQQQGEDFSMVEDAFQRNLHGRKIESLPTEAICWLSIASQKLKFSQKEELLRELHKRSLETVVTCSDQEIERLHDSVIRKRSAMLKALIECQPDSANIRPFAEELLAILQSDEWKASSDIGFAISALAEFDQKFSLRDDTRLKLLQNTSIRAHDNHSATDSSGFAVRRVFRAAHPASRVWQDASGTWHAKSGSKVIAAISIVPFKETSHFILHDYFAGGFVVQSSQLDPGHYYNPMALESLNPGPVKPAWHQGIDVHQDYINVFASKLNPTQYTYQYALIATSPGSYFVPPSMAVDPDDRTRLGYSNSDRFIIDP